MMNAEVNAESWKLEAGSWKLQNIVSQAHNGKGGRR
jgi:hypothetical protein